MEMKPHKDLTEKELLTTFIYEKSDFKPTDGIYLRDYFVFGLSATTATTISTPDYHRNSRKEEQIDVCMCSTRWQRMREFLMVLCQ